MITDLECLVQITSSIQSENIHRKYVLVNITEIIRLFMKNIFIISIPYQLTKINGNKNKIILMGKARQQQTLA